MNTSRRAALVLALFTLGCGGDDGPDGERVALSFCDLQNPNWVAIQDGDGPWTRLAPIREGQYEAHFTAGRGGVAYIAGGYGLVVSYGAASELRTIACPFGSKRVHGNVQNSSEARITIGGISSYAHVESDNRFKLFGVPDGSQDLLAERANYTPGSTNPDRLIVRRGLDAPSGSTLPVLDFGSAEAFAPVQVNVSASPLGAMQTAVARSTFIGSSGSLAATLSRDEGLISGPVPLLLVPADRLAAGELNLVDIYASDYVSDLTARYYVRAPLDMGLALGPELNTPAVSEGESGAFLHPRADLASQPEYGRLAYAVFAQESNQSTVVITAAYLGGTPASWAIVLPDFSGVDGWNNGWNLESGLEMFWTVGAEGGVSSALGDVVSAGDESMAAAMRGYDETSPTARALRRRSPVDAYRWGFKH